MSLKKADRQCEIFLSWVSAKIRKRCDRTVTSLEDFSDGVVLCHLCEALYGHKIPKYKWLKKPKNKAQMLVNLDIALRFIKSKGAKLVGIGQAGIHDGNKVHILGLLWTLILTFSLKHVSTEGGEDGASSNETGEISGQKELLLWARKAVGDRVDKLTDLNKSWKDGTAFCALISSYRPDLINMDDVAMVTPYERLEHAFGVAEDALNVPPILKPEDLLDHAVPDTKAIVTYLSELRLALESDAKVRMINWVNKALAHLDGATLRVNDLSDSWKDGTALCSLIHSFRPDLIDVDKIKSLSPRERVDLALRVARDLGVTDVPSVDEIRDGASPDVMSSFLDRLRKQLESDETRHAVEWINKKLASVAGGLHVHDMTHSWKDGLALCGLIHSFRPDLINMDKVETMSPRERVELALQIAGKLGVLSGPDVNAILNGADPKAMCAFIHRLRLQLEEDEKNRAREEREKVLRLEREKTANAARVSFLAAGYAWAFAKEATASCMDARDVTGTDYWVILAGPRVGVYVKREEADKFSENGKYPVSGFNNFQTAHKLAQDIQGGKDIWDKHFGDETDDDDIDTDSDDDDDDSDDDGKRRRRRRFSTTKRNRDQTALSAQMKLLSLMGERKSPTEILKQMETEFTTRR